MPLSVIVGLFALWELLTKNKTIYQANLHFKIVFAVVKFVKEP